jgi:hypothetical protein
MFISRFRHERNVNGGNEPEGGCFCRRGMPNFRHKIFILWPSPFLPGHYATPKGTHSFLAHDVYSRDKSCRRYVSDRHTKSFPYASSYISSGHIPVCGPGRSVGIVTDYGLDGPGIEFCWGEIFRTHPDRPWSPPSLLYNGFLLGVKRPGRGADNPPPPSAEVENE